MYFNREISDRLQRAAQSSPAVILTGARQTGKTTLLRHSFPKHHYITLDLPSTAERAEKDPAGFLREHPPPLIVDEVQYAPGLFRHLKLAIDEKRHEYGRFILTGSQKFTLMKEVADSLAGRCVLLELEGFGLGEISAAVRQDTATVSQELLERAILTGGFPELWSNPKLAREDFFSSYLATYLERDVRQLINVASLRDFERFVRACAARHGQLLDKSALARDVGISPKTANAWLSVLEASSQISLLEPWFANVGKRLIKSPKLYFNDSGLCAFLLGVTPASLGSSPFLGSLWEGLIYSELRKTLAARRNSLSLWFYRDDRQLEVDFLVMGGGRGDLIEAKWTEFPDASDARSVRELVQQLAIRPLRELSTPTAWVICRTPGRFPIGSATIRVDAISLTDYIAQLGVRLTGE
jgi:hypothetical protein